MPRLTRSSLPNNIIKWSIFFCAFCIKSSEWNRCGLSDWKIRRENESQVHIEIFIQLIGHVKLLLHIWFQFIFQLISFHLNQHYSVYYKQYIFSCKVSFNLLFSTMQYPIAPSHLINGYFLNTVTYQSPYTKINMNLIMSSQFYSIVVFIFLLLLLYHSKITDKILLHILM